MDPFFQENTKKTDGASPFGFIRDPFVPVQPIRLTTSVRPRASVRVPVRPFVPVLIRDHPSPDCRSALGLACHSAHACAGERTTSISDGRGRINRDG